MKKLNYLLASIFLLTSMGAFAQVDIKIEPCVQAKDAMTKQEKKELVKGIKSKRSLPKDFYTDRLIVFILNDKTENISNVVSRKGKGGNYNFNNTIKESKDACKNAGLNVHKYVVDHLQDQIIGSGLVSASISKEDLDMVKKSKAKYYVMISDNIGVREAQTATQAPGGMAMVEKDGVYAKVINVNDPLDIYTISTKELSKSGTSNNYNEGETIFRLSKEATFGGEYELPNDVKLTKIYFVNNPNLILPTSKPKGLMCKMVYNQQIRQKEDFLERNETTKKVLKKCKVDYDIVDAEPEVKTGLDVYILKYYEYHYTNMATGDRKTIEAFYLENTITKKVYAFKSGTVSNKYDKYLEKVIKEINEH